VRGGGDGGGLDMTQRENVDDIPFIIPGGVCGKEEEED